jgi:cell division transport system permease protein
MRVSLLAKETGVGLRRNLSLTVAVVITVAITLALTGFGVLISKEIALVKDVFVNRINVSVYLCGKTSLEPTCGGQAVTQAQRESIRADLEAMPEVKSVRYESQQAAYENYKRLFKDTPDLVRNVDPSALPEGFIVKLKDEDKFPVIAQRFSDRPGVQLVQDQQEYVVKLFKLLRGFQQGAFVVAAILAAAAALLIFNAIRIAAFNRRRETGIMRLVGASRSYVEMPFLLEGAVVGLVGGALGAGLLALFKWVLIDKSLAPTVKSLPFIGWEWLPTLLPGIVAVSVAFAMVTSFITASWYLRRT